jgi:HK97 family phage portal protein
MKWSLSSFLGTMRRFAGNVGSFFANATTLNSRQLAALLAATGASSAPEKQALKVCAWAMSAVNVITQTVAGLSVELHSGPVDSPTIVTSGPAVEFIAEPQPGQSTSWLLEQLAGHWNVGGEMNVVHNDVTMQPTPDARAVRYVAICSRPELAVNLRPDGGVLSYSYTPIDSSETMELSPLSIRRLLRFNPYSKHRGLAPLDAAALEIRQDYNAALYNASALENGGSPGGTWVLTNQPNDEQRREFERLMERRHVGAANANRMAVVWGADWKQTSFNNVDLALLDSRRFNREGIFAVFGVPPVMGGVFDAAHYNVAESSEKIFMLNTIRPLVERIEAVLNPIVEMIQPGVRVHVAIELHHVMQAIQRAMVAQLKELLASGVPYNEAVQFLQLPFKPQAWGNKSLLASGLMLADDVVAGMGTPSETPPPATPDDESDAVDDEEQAAALECIAPRTPRSGRKSRSCVRWRRTLLGA